MGFDRIMNLPGKFSDWIMPDKIHQLNVSFTVKSLREEFGGTGGNCAYTLGLLGMKPKLIGILGMDGLGYRDHLKQNGVKVDQIKIDKTMMSACGHVMTDLSDNQIWSYFPGPLTKLKNIRLQEFKDKESTFLALMPSEPAAFKKHLAELCQMKAHFMFDPAFFIPNLTKEELSLGIKQAEIIIGNDYEIALMEKRIKATMVTWFNGLMAKNAIVIKTLGEKGSEIYCQGEKINIPAAKVKAIVDPTGAGDAYRSGFLAGYMRDLDLKTCGQMGAVTAAYTVESFGTQTHKFTLKEFKKRFEANFSKKLNPSL